MMIDKVFFIKNRMLNHHPPTRVRQTEFSYLPSYLIG